MVIARLLAVSALAGCLSKPSPPSAEPDAPIADNGCPTGATPFPSELLLRRSVEIADLDRDGRDDLIMWGRDGTGKASVYVTSGRAPLALGCYDLALPLGDVEPLDVWVGDVTGDGALDLVTVSRGEDAYPIHLYRGLAAGGVDPIPEIQAPSQAQFGQDVGGVIADPLPVFVLGYRNGGTGEIIFGGLNEPFAGLVVTGTDLLRETLVRDDMTSGLSLGQFEELGLAGAPGAQELFAVSSSTATTLANVGRDLDVTRFARSASVPLHGGGPQLVRFARTPVGGATIAVTEVNEGDFDVIAARAGAAPTVSLLRADIDRMNVRDLALALVDANAQVDLFVLAETFVGSELTLFRDLALSDPVTHEVPLRTSLSGSLTMLALGKFDGAEEHLLVLSVTSPAAGVCYHLVQGAPQACLVTCDVTACP